MIDDEKILAHLRQVAYFVGHREFKIESSRHTPLKSAWNILTDRGRYRVIQQATDRHDFIQADGVKRMQRRGVDYLQCLHYETEMGLAVYNWLPGKPIFMFDDINAASAFTSDRIRNLVCRLAELHAEESVGFSPVTDEPSYNPCMRKRLQLSSRNQYLLHALSSFMNAWDEHLSRAKDRRLISNNQWRELVQIETVCRRKVMKDIGVLDSVDTFSFLHGDLTPENIICNNSEVFLIDFEYWHYGDRAIELAFMLEQFRQANALSGEKEKEFVEIYKRRLEERGVTDKYLTVRLAFLLRYVLWKFLVLVADGLTTPANDVLNRNLFANMLYRSQITLEEDVT